MKKIIRLTESDLHRIIRRCINEAINNDLSGYFYMLIDGQDVPIGNFHTLNEALEFASKWREKYGDKHEDGKYNGSTTIRCKFNNPSYKNILGFTFEEDDNAYGMNVYLRSRDASNDYKYICDVDDFIDFIYEMNKIENFL